MLSWQLNMSLEGLSHPTNRMPFNQFGGAPLRLGQLGSGVVDQPFKTVEDYNNWISRAGVFPAYADSAIVYFRKGMAEGVVHPEDIGGKD